MKRLIGVAVATVVTCAFAGQAFAGIEPSPFKQGNSAAIPPQMKERAEILSVDLECRLVVQVETMSVTCQGEATQGKTGVAPGASITKIHRNACPPGSKKNQSEAGVRTFIYTVEVVNVGNANAKNPIKIEMDLVGGGTWSSLGTQTFADGLKAGAANTRKAVFTKAAGEVSVGSVTARATVSYDGSEKKKANNTVSHNFTLK